MSAVPTPGPQHPRALTATPWPTTTLAILASQDLPGLTATLRRKIVTVPVRLVHSGRRADLRLPDIWLWADAISQALASIHAIGSAAERHSRLNAHESAEPRTGR